MHSLKDIAKQLNRPVPYLKGLQTRFSLPSFDGARYSDGYYALLRKLVYLRTLGVSEESLCALWALEKKICELLNADSASSPTWFLDSSDCKDHRKRRLLLTGYDVGADLSATRAQLGLNFSASNPELFTAIEMGINILELLEDFKAKRKRILSTAQQERRLLRCAVNWSNTLDCEI